MIIVIVMCILFVLSILAAFFYVLLMLHKHKKRFNLLKERFDLQEHTDEEKKGFDLLIEREKNFIRNYITFQIVGKICEMLSIVFSVSSFAFTFIIDNRIVFSVGKQIIPLMSVVMIIVVIYIVPSRRWAEYLQAWREMDYSINCILEGSISFNNIPEILKEIESCITSDKI